MTSDAKIGLLLGLVFIFIIAFVINGLPRFQNSVDNSVQAAEDTFVQADPLGYGVRNSYAAEEQNYQEDIITPVPAGDYDNEVLLNNNPWATDHATVEDNDTGVYYANDYYEPESESTSDYTSLSEDNSESSVSENEDVRIVVDSSQENERLRLELPTPVAAEREVSLEGSNNRDDNRTGMRPSNPFGGNGFQMNGGFRQNGNGGQFNPRGGQGGFGQPGNMNQQRQGQISTPSRENQVIPVTPNNPIVQRTQQGQAFREKTYVIQEGDNNLAKISKKFYGEEEGNRLVNINKIYEANKETLKSPDKIFVGQKIVIPEPAAPVEPRPSDVLQGGMFQNVTLMGGTTARQNNNSRLDKEDWYEVKEDDSLWKIAAQQLGNGARFEEISKLNTDILTDKNKLKPGMKLRLPAK
ncbi:MAG: LysM peptidoglycan-binding domain-containing protein [Sedimentisphaerales bacterium]|nr:LysM peptidoglycan-binding domain-containing protein [Sedimentisphaerales bacterium]